jgi:membrane-bound metal-dependent hydrolase YbcI (DUF457 family)
MPTPVAHSIISLALSDGDSGRGRSMLKWAAFWVVLGNFADFDFIPGILIGTPSRFHHGCTHSILFAVTLAFVAYWFYPTLFRGKKVPFWIFLSVTGSHLFLDAMTLDTVGPFGIPLLWPFSYQYFRFPFSIFLNVNRSLNPAILLSWHNFFAVFLEVALTLPILLVLWVFRHGKKIFSSRGGDIARGKRGEVLSN